VIEKLLETLFRHKLLILLPPVLIPLIVGPIALLTVPVYYETWTGVWVERSTYLSYSDGWNQYMTPAQNQANRLTELLRTRAFLRDVAAQTSLASLLASPVGEQRAQTMIERGISVMTSGSHLLVIRFRGESPQLSFQAINAVVETFKERTANDRLNQAGLAISFYESRLQAAEEEYSKTNGALSRYVAGNPRLTALDPERGAGGSTAARLGLPPMAIDPQLGGLLRGVEQQQAAVDRARTSLDQARLESAAALEGHELGFQVVDPARPPTAPSRELRKRLIFPAAAVVVGLGLSAALLVLLVAADRTVRSPADLPPSIRVAGVVPRLRRIPGASGPDAVRQAIGFPAGTALPEPRGAK
jgi:uncharacterized protein involved in exopolysaccharide biosynthesis